MQSHRTFVLRKRAMTLLELLIVIGIIGLLIGILLPTIEGTREHANTVRCAVNLSQIGATIQMYANDNKGHYPRTVYNPAAPVTEGTNPDAADPYRAGGPKANDVTAALFLLCRARGLPSVLFNDPYDDELETTPDVAPDLANRSNFTDFRKNLAYSYANPYPSAAAVTAGYGLTNRINPAFPI